MMDKILNEISYVVSEAFELCGYDSSYGRVNVSNRPDLCEFQCNGALAAAKVYKKAPIVIAREIEERIAENPLFEEVSSVMPGFINLKIGKAVLAKRMTQMLWDERLGCYTAEQPLQVIVDYGGPNVAKPLHVGHLRSAVIGESVKRILKFFGHHVLGDVHLGDWGLQMGLIIEELRDRRPDLLYFQEEYEGEYPKEAPFTLSDLEEIYPAASAKAKEQEEFRERAQRATLKIQNGDPAFTAIWKHIMSLSVADLKKNYDNLNVSFDLWKGESDAGPYISDMIQELIDKGLAYESQGALVVDIQEEQDLKEFPPCLIRKSDGAALYATSDLATLVEREKLYQPNYYIYLADKRQSLHFTQIFRVARKAGIVKKDTRMEFLGFGTMNGRDGKPFKTRDGGVMRLENLIQEIYDAVYEKVKENPEIPQQDIDSTTKKIALAALKYGDLSNQASKDYIFDIERFIAFEGNTGPYILYTIVRIKSILKRYAELGGNEEKATQIQEPSSQTEKDLMLELSKLPYALEGACEEIAPHKICQYIYDLSNSFSHFYSNNKIITETDKEKQSSWIALSKLTKKTLETCIDLLGMEAPERM